MDYAIIRLGNKQHRVRDGETLVVDRVHTDAGESFEPVVLLGSGKVTATVVAHERGPKVVIGKYRKRTGYKRHNGFRAATSRLTISFGGRQVAAPPTGRPAAPRRPKTPAEPPAVVSEAVSEPAPEAVAPAAPALPEGYASMTVAQVAAAAGGWSASQLEAALAHERAHASRKGALSALESALAREEG